MGDSSGNNSDPSFPIGEWWIDDDGAWRGGPFLALVSPSSDGEARRDAECGALFHLGMANIRLTSNRIHVRWSVQHVEPETLRAVRDFLAGLTAPPRIVLEYYFGAWERLRFNDPEEAKASLDAAASYRGTIPMMTPFVRRLPLDDETLSAPTIRATLSAWEAAKGKFTLSGDNAFSPFNERVLAFAPNAGESDLIYDHLGSQAALTRFKGKAWADEVHGKTCGRGVEQVSKNDVLTGPYGQVLESDAPRLDYIRARITRSTEVSEWVTYQRLLMPAKGDRGEPLVLCMASRTAQINIPRSEKTA